MVEIQELKFDENGLIPAVVQDAVTKKVLMVAYMNEESLRVTMEKELACFYSRSRQELWIKGETSGNYQHVVSVTADCDRDTLLVLVEPEGPACHLGTETCFEYPVWENEELKEFSYEMLMKLIDRESGVTSYEVIELYKGSLAANFWQGIAKMFGNDLKEEYDGKDKDKITERIILLVEAGQL